MGLASRVEVLLATYNGEKFVREQIESILRQEYDDLAVLARDDGSKDDTLEILKEYAQRFPNRFRLVDAGAPHAGIVNNFLSLMKASTAPYVCFCDQDDVWLPNKVAKTKAVMDELEAHWGPNSPLLVFTDLRVVDQDLRTVYPSFWESMGIHPELANNFPRLLTHPVMTGCTMMSNRRLIQLALSMPANASLHDRWIGLLASAMGNVAFLREQTVLYRQHGSNAIGIATGEVPKSVFQRIRQSGTEAAAHVRNWQIYQDDANALLRQYETELPANNRRLLRTFVRCESASSPFARIVMFLRHGAYSRGPLATIAILSYLWRKRAGRRREQDAL